jgi:hypothetical protein
MTYVKHRCGDAHDRVGTICLAFLPSDVIGHCEPTLDRAYDQQCDSSAAIWNAHYDVCLASRCGAFLLALGWSAVMTKTAQRCEAVGAFGADFNTDFDRQHSI